MLYQNLDVFQRSYRLSIEIQKLSLELEKSYQFELIDQIRRASRSIPSNIAEAFGRSKSKKDTINHLKDSLGSNDEMLFNMRFMGDAKLISGDECKKLSDEYTITGKELFMLIKKINNLRMGAKAV
jgi:four helix bundle protein